MTAVAQSNGSYGPSPGLSPVVPPILQRAARRTGWALLTGAITLAVVIGAWILFLKAFHVSPFVGKGPVDVWRYLTSGPDASSNRSGLLQESGFTLRDAFLGLAGGTVAAIGCAIAFNLSRAASSTFMPLAMVVLCHLLAQHMLEDRRFRALWPGSAAIGPMRTAHTREPWKSHEEVISEPMARAPGTATDVVVRENDSPDRNDPCQEAVVEWGGLYMGFVPGAVLEINALRPIEVRSRQVKSEASWRLRRQVRPTETRHQNRLNSCRSG